MSERRCVKNKNEQRISANDYYCAHFTATVDHRPKLRKMWIKVKPNVILVLGIGHIFCMFESTFRRNKTQ